MIIFHSINSTNPLHFLASFSVSFFRDLKFIVETLPLWWGLFSDAMLFQATVDGSVSMLSFTVYLLNHSITKGITRERRLKTLSNSPPSDDGLKGGAGHIDTGPSGTYYFVECQGKKRSLRAELKLLRPCEPWRSIAVCRRLGSAMAEPGSQQPARASAWPCSIKPLFMGTEIWISCNFHVSQNIILIFCPAI